MEPTVPLAPPAATDSRLSSRLTRAAEALDGQRPLSSAQLRKAAVALKNGPPGAAKSLLTDYLARHPGDCDAMYLLARVLMAAHESMHAEELLAQCLEQLPDFDAARFHYARTLLERMKSEAALDQVEILLAKDPKNFLFRDLKGTALWRLGRDAEAVEWYRALTDDYPDMEVFWLRYAYRLRAVGRREECIRAYRKLIEICPSYGGAYWSLGDLKTFRFSGNDIAEMQTQLRGTNLSAENRSYFHFALAKAYADQELYGKAFEQYARANALRRVEVDHDPNLATDYVTACKALMTREFFEARAECGTASSGPIFVLGMHRSGSTLVEQILSSHSAIEGIGEAPEIMSFAKRLEFEIAPKYGTGYPGIIGLVDAATLTALGNEYLKSVAPRRKLRRPFFVDKSPGNVWFAGLIHLVLPNAKIVDVRRHPVACCFSNFTTIFDGVPWTYRQSDIGRYYAEYVRYMAYLDRVLPGRIHRVIYERLVSDTETEVRRLLDYLGLPFERACLEFYNTERAVATPSSEQVRRPINLEGIDRWRHYEPWLAPLKAALGPVLEVYPDVPQFDS